MQGLSGKVTREMFMDALYQCNEIEKVDGILHSTALFGPESLVSYLQEIPTVPYIPTYLL